MTSPPAGAVADAPTGPVCPTCGAGVQLAHRFCEQCGTELTVSRCTECGGDIADDGYCSQCGAPAARQRDHWAETPASWVGGVCDRGVRHSRNEDAMALSAGEVPGGSAVLVVCDGVSAAPGSDIASLAAARAARDVLAGAAEDGVADGSVDARIETWTARLREATAAADDAAARVGHEQEAALGHPPANPPSCTFVAAVVHGPVVVAAWIGDSRAYWLPDTGPAEQLSVDDSWATEQIALGLSREEAEAMPQAHAITRWLGADSPGNDPRCTSRTPSGPGWLAVVSDGLWNYCSPAQDVARLVTDAALRHGGDPTAAADDLVRWANGEGGQDNVTVALARLPGSGVSEPGGVPASGSGGD